MIGRKLSAGDIIDARCTKCREILNHRIVAMVEGKVVRVECNTCNGVHNYYPPPTAKEVKAAKISKVTKDPSSARTSSAPRSSKKDPTEADREEWASLKTTMQIDRAQDYDMNGAYRLNSLILHSVFGLGVVKRLILPNKMQVLFQDGIKLLRCQ